jgi:hypothetical protein
MLRNQIATRLNKEELSLERDRLFREKALQVMPGDDPGRVEWKQKMKELKKQHLENMAIATTKDQMKCSLCGEAKHALTRLAQCPNRLKIINEIKLDIGKQQAKK